MKEAHVDNEVEETLASLERLLSHPDRAGLISRVKDLIGHAN